MQHNKQSQNEDQVWQNLWSLASSSKYHATPYMLVYLDPNTAEFSRSMESDNAVALLSPEVEIKLQTFSHTWQKFYHWCAPHPRLGYFQ